MYRAHNTQLTVSHGISDYRWNIQYGVHTVFHEYLAGIIFSEFVILEISPVFNLAIPKKKKK